MKHKLLTLASAAALLAACSDTTVSDANDEIKDKATVTFMVLDNNTMLPLENVSVYYRPTDKTKETDSAGTVIWKDVELGTDIYWDFQKEGYAKKRFSYSFDDLIQNDVARVKDLHPEVTMYKLGVNIQGKFYYTDVETGNYLPAANVKVYAKYTGDAEIYPNEVYTTTKEDGSYEFKNMASDVEITVSGERFTLEGTNIVYDETVIDVFTQRKGEAKEVIKELDPKAASVLGLTPVLLSSNLKKIDSTTALQLTFSEELEKDSVKTTQVYVENAFGKKVAVVVSYDADKKVVSVKPASGKWVDGNDYKVYFSVWTKTAIEDQDADGSRDFSVGTVKIPGKAENVRLDTAKNKDVVLSFFGERSYDTRNDTINYNANINLIWKEVTKGIKGYNVYVKGDNAENADFVKVKELGAASHSTSIDVAAFLNDDTNLKYPISNKEVKTVQIIVLPFSSAGESIASSADVITVKVADLAKKKVETYEKATVKNIDSFTPTGYVCDAAEIAPYAGDCSITTKRTDMKNKYFALSYQIKFTAKDNDGAAGYLTYYKNGNKWVKVSSGTSTTVVVAPNSVEDGPFEKALDYGEDKNLSKYAEFAIVPYFNTPGGGVISATSIGSTGSVSRKIDVLLDNL
ncbi:MAG: Ig-like domain-containing protein [Fibrobacter sp.]|nr:Ig-like domain-containing protein [Fibrobacter sp.]